MSFCHKLKKKKSKPLNVMLISLKPLKLISFRFNKHFYEKCSEVNNNIGQNIFSTFYDSLYIPCKVQTFFSLGNWQPQVLKTRYFIRTQRVYKPMYN